MARNYVFRELNDYGLQEIQDIYGVYDELFMIKLHHGGRFIDFPGRRYVEGKVTYVDMVDIERFSVIVVGDILEELGYDGHATHFYSFLKPDYDLDNGLEPLGCDQDVHHFMKYVRQNKEMSVYIEHNVPTVNTFLSPKKPLVLQCFDDEVVVPTKSNQIRAKNSSFIPRNLLLENRGTQEPATGQLLAAVGVDSNNGIYPLAYAIVEAENYNSWSWFLELLRDDLDLQSNSNFTFISDRQKGLLGAVTRIFPNAEHRFCLRHIHENMKKRWNGLAYKDHLWSCATATTVPQFEKAMLELKEFNQDTWKYLKDIPAKHWAMSHFTGRAKTDVLLNNMCEVLNWWLVPARDKPIITCLEYVREYMMKRIVNVKKVCAKSDGHLTPKATQLFEAIKDDARKYTVLWSGSDQYQVSGPHKDQCVVDSVRRSCACNKWELTGMPCKHAVAAMWNNTFNSRDVSVPEQWVDKIYWLDTWIKTYSFTIKPLNGRSLWHKSSVTNVLQPPKMIASAGRPKKNRRKTLDEKESMVNGVHLSRKGKSTTCGTCGGYGHNKRSCSTSTNVGKRKSKTASGSGSKKKKPSNEAN